ncbi:oxidoreductase [Novisyntrophococcus fermenticellae]|uniref:oxidoreductase n=1 Tax=Novisyntrophococcus fermenticellae TaxID=2068655 RepID=UPI001E475687|nr:FAD-dependent oxidoreductase [Novisyntrophococcus fermenticellae]
MKKLKYPHLFEPITLGKTLFRNRIFGSPLGGMNLYEGKFPGTESHAFYARKAKGGAASVAIGECVVDSAHGRGGPVHTAIDDIRAISYLSKLAENINRYGAVPVAELAHAGMYSEASHAAGNPLYGPVSMTVKGAVASAGVSQVEEIPAEVIEQTIEAYANSALTAKNCGFGMVMIHGGHGWLMSQFISPYTNTRTDEWGGSSRENRMRLPLAVIERIRQKCGADFPIEFRMSGDECNPAGYGIEEGIEIAKMLDGKVDLIHVSTGVHECYSSFTKTSPGLFDEDGCNAHYAAEIKKHVKTPVATVGAFSDPAQMEELIASGKVDIIEIARGLMADPDLPNKARRGRDEDIRQCIRCLECFSSLLNKFQFCCAINPEISNELDGDVLKPAEVKKKILIAGGGIAGMEAALAAIKCGHEVVLCEKSGNLGGVLKVEEKVPFKQKLDRYLNQQARLVMESGADVRLDTEVTPELAEEIAPDVIIAAMGARPVIPPIPGIDGSNVIGAEEAYLDTEKVGKKVVMLGGGLVGIELGLYLARLGREVTVVEMMPQPNLGGNTCHGIALDQEIEKRNLKLILSTKALEVTDKGVWTENMNSRTFYEADTVIYATGMRPLREEAAALRECSPEFYQIGDCVTPKNIHQATKTAYYIVSSLGKF